MVDEPESQDPNLSQASSQSSFFQPRPSLDRGFAAYTQSPKQSDSSRHLSQPSRTDRTVPSGDDASLTPPSNKRSWWPLSKWISGRRSSEGQRATEIDQTEPRTTEPRNSAFGDRTAATASRYGHPSVDPRGATYTGLPSLSPPWQSPAQQPEPPSSHFESPVESSGSPWVGPSRTVAGEPAVGPYAPPLAEPFPPERGRRVWEKQPYSAGLHLLALAGSCSLAWLLGIVAAQVLPGSFEQPPLQEAVLRRVSRVGQTLWPPTRLWESRQQETRVEPIPLPTVGPTAGEVALSPIERQPLLDELNAIDTDILTLERRLQALERQLGSPPYEGGGVDYRVETLRATLDPPVRAAAEPSGYTPKPREGSAQLLEVAELKITLPSDALFTPGQRDLRESGLLNQVLDQLAVYPAATVVIRSYSDDQADAIASREFTLAQADTLARYLQAALPIRHRWVTLGGGRSQPLVSNDDPLNRQQNRRIEILVDTR